MADNILAKQRENRKKKLLENSEDRLKKLMGIDKSTDKEADTSILQESLINHYTNLQGHPVLHSNEDTTSSEDIDQQVSISLNNSSEHNLGSKIESHSHVQNDHKANVKDEELASSECLSTPTPVLELHNNLNYQDEPTGSSASRRRSMPSRTSNITTSTRLSLCAALAAAMRLLILMNISVVFETSVIAPFLMLELTFFIYDKLSQDAHLKPQVTGILSAILLFSGVSQTAIDWIATIMTLLSKIFEDFSVYFFTFCVIHLILDDNLETIDIA